MYVTFLGSTDWRIVVVTEGGLNSFMRGPDNKSLKFKSKEEAEAFVATQGTIPVLKEIK